MARNKRSLAKAKPLFTPPLVKQVCDSWPLLERMALHQTTTHRWSFEEDIQAYQQLGVRAFGAWRFKLEDYGEEKAFDLLKDHNLTVSSLSWAGGFIFSGCDGYDSAISDALDAVELAQKIEASCLVVVPGSRGAYTLSHGRRMIIDALRRVGDAAGEAGIQVALQPVDPAYADERCFLDSLDKLMCLLNDCGHSQIGLNLDVFHLRKTPNLSNKMADLLPWIRLVQLSDCCNPQAELDRCLLGEGELPLWEIVDNLETAGYRGFYDANLMSTSAWNSSYDDVLQQTCAQFEQWALSSIESERDGVI